MVIEPSEGEWSQKHQVHPGSDVPNPLAGTVPDHLGRKHGGERNPKERGGGDTYADSLDDSERAAYPPFPKPQQARKTERQREEKKLQNEELRVAAQNLDSGHPGKQHDVAAARATWIEQTYG